MSFLLLSSFGRHGALRAPPMTRSVSSSPYGRTHVWRRRAPKLPNPVVPHFPQRVVLSDGSTYIHWTTSPRSTIKLTRDTRNAPLWAPWLAGSNPEDVEGASAGRLGRFRRKFEELGESANEMEMGQWDGIASRGDGYVAFPSRERRILTHSFQTKGPYGREDICKAEVVLHPHLWPILHHPS